MPGDVLFGRSLGSTQCRYELISQIPALERLEKEWDELYARTPDARLGQCYRWARLCWKMVSEPHGHRLACIIGRIEGRLVLVWPLAIVRKWTLSVAQPLDSDSSEYAAALVEDDPSATRWLLDAWDFLRRLTKADAVVLPNTRADSALHAAVIQVPARKTVTYSDDAPWLDHRQTGGWRQHYQKTKKRRAHLSVARLERRLNEAGQLVYRTLSNPVECEPLVDWLLDQKVAWLRRNKIRNEWLPSQWFRAFVKASFVEFGPSGQRLMFIALFDSQPIGALLASLDATRTEFFMIATDPEFSKYGPGNLLVQSLIRWSLERNLDVDMRLGNTTFKSLWSNAVCSVQTHVLAASPRGAALVAVLAATCRSKRALRSLRTKVTTAMPRLANLTAIGGKSSSPN